MYVLGAEAAGGADDPVVGHPGATPPGKGVLLQLAPLRISGERQHVVQAARVLHLQPEEAGQRVGILLPLQAAEVKYLHRILLSLLSMKQGYFAQGVTFCFPLQN